MAYDEQLADRVRDVLEEVDGVGEKRMFGGLAFLVGGHMAVAVSGQGGLMVRADPTTSGDLLADPRAAPMVMRGRELRGWLLVDVEGLAADDDLGRWVDVGVATAEALPPK